MGQGRTSKPASQASITAANFAAPSLAAPKRNSAATMADSQT